MTAGLGEGPGEFGPFAGGVPGLGYIDYLREFDHDAEMWRQVVPGQHGRGLALGRWGLHNYEEYADYPDAIDLDGDPLWVPIMVEWRSVTELDGTVIKPSREYLEAFHGMEYEHGEDALPVVGITSAKAVWSSLTGPWTVHTPDGLSWEAFDVYPAASLDMVMPVQSVLPIEDDQLLVALAETIDRTERMWPMDDCSPSSIGFYEPWYGDERADYDTMVKEMGHTPACFEKQEISGLGGQPYYLLSCRWDPMRRCCTPCGGRGHISAVLESFFESQPYERLSFDPSLIPVWDRLKQRNVNLYQSLLALEEQDLLGTRKGRSWYYSYLRRWSPWGHSSQVPGLLPV